MRVVVAPDKFRGSMTAGEAAAAMVAGVRDVHPSAEVIALPLADGGEGTLDVLLYAVGGTRKTVTVTGPLGAPVAAAWGLLDEGSAVVEIASASGAVLLAPSDRDPMTASTFGTGELIRAACRHRPRPRRIVVALGGSASNDGGAGLLEALGARITDADEHPVARGGAALRSVERVELAAARAALGEIELVGACDVDAVLYGPVGAARLFGPQKGASPDQIDLLDAAMERWATVLAAAAGTDAGALAQRRGTGAAGGTGVALAALGAELVSGAELVLDAVGFERALSDATLVLTGEGRVDAQSDAGKLVGAVARRAAGRVPMIVFCGSLDADLARLPRLGLGEVHVIGDGSDDAAALGRGAVELRRAVCDVLRRVAIDRREPPRPRENGRSA